MPHCLIVCGFHRSGTSMLMQSLARAGLHIGNQLMRGSASNPDGHFEDLPTVHLHDRWLNENKSHWCHVQALPQVPEDSAISMDDIVNRLGNTGADWGIKDPRFSLFLTPWVSHLAQSDEQNAAVLGIFRHPAKCFDSLRRRAADALLTSPRTDAIQVQLWQEQDHALRSWLIHNEAIIEHARRYPQRTMIMSQEAILEGSTFIAEVNKKLGTTLNTSEKTCVRPAYARSHHKAQMPEMDFELRTRIDMVWERLCDIADISPPENMCEMNGSAPSRESYEKLAIQSSDYPEEHEEHFQLLEHALRQLSTRYPFQATVSAKPAQKLPKLHSPTRLSHNLIAEGDASCPAFDSIARLRLGVRCHESRQWRKAIQHLTVSWSQRKNPSAMVWLCRSHMAALQHESALEYSRTGQYYYPGDARFVLLEADVLDAMNFTDRAIATCETQAKRFSASTVWNALARRQAICGQHDASSASLAMGLACLFHSEKRSSERLYSILRSLSNNTTRKQLLQVWLSILDDAMQNIDRNFNNTRVRELPKYSTNLTLAMSLLVRDEADIIEPVIRFHAAHGVDHFIVTDNGSVDGTREILSSLQSDLSLEIIDEPSNNYDQDLWMNRMALQLQSSGEYDWLIHNDADEFWMPNRGTLKEAIQQTLSKGRAGETGVLVCDRYNMLAYQEQIDSTGYDFWQNIHKLVKTVPLQTGEQPWSKDNSNCLARLVPGKVLTLLNGFTSVAVGNHSAQHELQTQQCPDISILHFPVRGYKQFERKVYNQGAALANNNRFGAGTCKHIRYWYSRYLQGELEVEFNQIVFNSARMAELEIRGHICVDTRLTDFIEKGILTSHPDIYGRSVK